MITWFGRVRGMDRIKILIRELQLKFKEKRSVGNPQHEGLGKYWKASRK
jgi:hypothetical protein